MRLLLMNEDSTELRAVSNHWLILVVLLRRTLLQLDGGYIEAAVDTPYGSNGADNMVGYIVKIGNSASMKK